MPLIIRALIAGLFFVSFAAYAQPSGVITVLQGAMRIIRGDESMPASAGMSVKEGDLLATTANSFVALELGNGAIFGFGGQSHAYIYRMPKPGKAGQILLREGWMKADLTDQPFNITLPGMQVEATGSRFVVAGSSKRNALFLESGKATVIRLDKGGKNARIAVSERQFLTQPTGKPISTTAQPDADFLGEMPRSFRDRLPSLANRYPKKIDRPANAKPVANEEIAPWIRMGAPWNDGLTKRFKGPQKDSASPAAVKPNISHHKDSAPTLSPKERPKESPQERASPNANIFFDY